MSAPAALLARTLPAGDAGLAAAEAAWATVEAAHPGLPVSRTWAWTSAWVRHFGPGIPHRFVVVEDAQGRVRGATIVTRHVRGPRAVGLRRAYLGTGGEPGSERLCPEDNGPAALPGEDAAVLSAVADAVAGERWWDELRIERAAPDVATGLLAGWPAGRTEIETMPAYQYHLDGLAPDEDVPSGLRGGPRRRVRTSLRAMEARGPLRVEWAEDAATAAVIFEDLVGLHQDAWQAIGAPGIFASPRFAGFHRELAPALVAAGRATMVRVWCGEQPIAALYGFRDGDRLLAYQSGLQRYDDNRLRPGVVAHVLAMEEARHRGVAVYDHLAGDARYKQELSTATTATRSLALRRTRRARVAVYDGVRDIHHRRAAALERRAERATAGAAA